jgi:predicted Zn-dependent protease with MMP-like domain
VDESEDLPAVKFADFERYAREAFEEIPDLYREGVDGLVVRRDAVAHPDLPDVYTLGECLTEEHLSDFGSAETTRSVIALYWGSFRELSRRNPDFDWEEEAWDTLTHELRHHLESLAGDDALEGVDYASDETFKRFDGDGFDPWYFQFGDRVEPGVYRVEKAWYLEQMWHPADFDAVETIDFAWKGGRYRIPRPDELGDVHFVLTEGLSTEEEPVEVVLVRRRSWWENVKRVLSSSETVVLESDAVAEPIGSEG